MRTIMTIKRNWKDTAILLLVLTVVITHWPSRSVHAQTPTNVLQISGAYATHTACTPVPSQSSACLASDGLWVSVNGAAFTQLGAAAVGGVTSVAVCNLTGLTCAPAQTGAVTVNIPKSIAITAGSATLQ